MVDFRSLLPARFRRDQLVVPVVRMSGAIMAAGNPLRPTLSLSGIAGVLERAFSYKRSPVVAIAINSPGGSAVQSRLIHNRIRQLAERHGKRVLVFVEDVAASGGYMISLAGDEIIADEASIVGSIGVVSAGFGFTEAIGKIGVERRVYTAGENKAILDPFKPERKSDIAHLKLLQQEMHDIFIDMVKKARGAKLAEDPDLFSGLFWTGNKALELGLIDQCGQLGEVIAERYGKKTKLRVIQPRLSLLGRPQPGAGVSASGEAARSAGLGLAQGLPDALLSAADERALWGRYGL